MKTCVTMGQLSKAWEALKALESASMRKVEEGLASGKISLKLPKSLQVTKGN